MLETFIQFCSPPITDTDVELLLFQCRCFSHFFFYKRSNFDFLGKAVSLCSAFADKSPKSYSNLFRQCVHAWWLSGCVELRGAGNNCDAHVCAVCECEREIGTNLFMVNEHQKDVWHLVIPLSALPNCPFSWRSSAILILPGFPSLTSSTS